MALEVIGVNLIDVLFESVLECPVSGFAEREQCQLENGGRLEHPEQMTGHESPPHHETLDGTKDEITL